MRVDHPRADKIVHFLLFISVSFDFALSQSILFPKEFETDRFPISRRATDQRFTLSSSPIIPSSETIYLDSSRIIRSTDYLIDYSSGVVVLKKNLSTTELESTSVMTIFYRRLPVSFKPEYRHRLLISESVNQSEEGRRTAILESQVSRQAEYDQVQKSGMLFRGFTVGSNRDLSLTSGFRLQLAGNLSDEIGILAALTDENVPIQPEGNTQNLQEVDNVYIKLRSRNFEATLGDFVFSANPTEFGSFNRRLQGIEGIGRIQSQNLSGSGNIVLASTRGKYHSLQFGGIEGMQGPYRIHGKNGERTIIIIAGSERIFVDGVLMTRGEANDYSIDYSTAEITFSSRRLITSYSRIAVDFEYSDRYYERNLIALQSDGKMVNNALHYQLLYFQEGDDKDSPIDLLLSDSDRDLLRQSGPNKAHKSGIQYVGIDTTTGIGKGQYALVDSLTGTDTLHFFRYEIGTVDALYQVKFSSVGVGSGDYARSSYGKYLYVGKNQGEFLPVEFLPKPEKNQLFDLKAIAQFWDGFQVDLEGAGSSYQSNTFSQSDPMQGFAGKASLKLQSRQIQLFNHKLGDIEGSATERFISKEFTPIDRVNSADFQRAWGFDSTSTFVKSDERIGEYSIAYSPIREAKVQTELGRFDRSTRFKANRYSTTLKISSDSIFFFNLTHENLTSDDSYASVRGDWIRQNGNGEFTWKYFTPSMRIEREDRSLRSYSRDSLLSSSFFFTAISPAVSFRFEEMLKIRGEMEWRSEKAPIGGILEPQAHSRTEKGNLQYQPNAIIRTSLDIAHSRKDYLPGFQSISRSDINALLVRSQTQFVPFRRALDADVLYEVSTQRASRLQRIFQKVKKGDGTYIWVDGNQNGLVDLTDERDFQISRYDGEFLVYVVPSEVLYPIINLKGSARLRLTPARIIEGSTNTINRILREMSTETYVRIEEKSSDNIQSNVYLLKVDKFLNPATTISGRQIFQQDLNLFEDSRLVSLRFRFLQRQGLNQYNSGTERDFYRDRSVRIRSSLTKDIQNQTDFSNQRNTLTSASLLNRARAIEKNDLATDFTFRPSNNIEYGLALQSFISEDGQPGSESEADFNTQSVRLIVGFLTNGQAKARIAREEVLVRTMKTGAIASYDLTDGRKEGKSYFWSFSLDYRLSNNVQATVSYDARLEAKAPAVHTARAEVRAFF